MEGLGYSCDPLDVGRVAFGTARWELELIDDVAVRSEARFVFVSGQVDAFAEAGGTFGDRGGLPAGGAGLADALSEGFAGDAGLNALFISGLGVFGGGGPVRARVLDAFLVLGLCGACAAGPFLGGAVCGLDGCDNDILRNELPVTVLVG